MLNCEKALLAMNDVPDAYIESARAMLGYRVGEQKRFSVRKRIIAFALAAALVLSLGIAAYAVYVHWSRGMERKLPATGTEKQRAEESGLSDTSQTVSATANGVTISVEQTVIDGDTAEIALRIEGWKLDRAQELNAAIWGGFPTFDGESAPASGGSFVEERGADDCAHIIAADGSSEYDFWARAGDKLGTLSGREISITIESLGVSGKGGPYQPLVEGPWVLTWTHYVLGGALLSTAVFGFPGCAHRRHRAAASLGGDQSRLRKGQPKVRQAVGGLRNSGRF